MVLKYKNPSCNFLIYTGRRKETPSDEEIARNLAIMQLKKQKAIEVDAKGGLPTPVQKGMETFPIRPEYERIPGKKG